MRLVTRREIAQELRVCTATLDNWLREYELQNSSAFYPKTRKMWIYNKRIQWTFKDNMAMQHGQNV